MKYKFTYKVVLGLLFVVLGLSVTSCKSEESYLFENAFTVPESIELPFNEETLIAFPNVADQQVFPASVLDVTVVSEDEKVVEVVSGFLVRAVGGGTTSVNIYDKNGQLLKSTSITVPSTHTVTIKVGEKVTLTDVIGYSYSMAYNPPVSTNPSVAAIKQDRYYFIEGISEGVAYICSRIPESVKLDEPFIIQVIVEP